MTPGNDDRLCCNYPDIFLRKSPFLPSFLTEDPKDRPEGYCFYSEPITLQGMPLKYEGRRLACLDDDVLVALLVLLQQQGTDHLCCQVQDFLALLGWPNTHTCRRFVVEGLRALKTFCYQPPFRLTSETYNGRHLVFCGLLDFVAYDPDTRQLYIHLNRVFLQERVQRAGRPIDAGPRLQLTNALARELYRFLVQLPPGETWTGPLEVAAGWQDELLPVEELPALDTVVALALEELQRLALIGSRSQLLSTGRVRLEKTTNWL